MAPRETQPLPIIYCSVGARDLPRQISQKASMKYSATFLAALPFLAAPSALAFSTPQTATKSTTTFSPRQTTSRLQVGEAVTEFDPQGLVSLKQAQMLTPEGYGFTAAAKRIVAEAGRRGNGYYRASSTQNIFEVIQAITDGEYDAALVFDEENNNKIVGLFTESDFIRVSNLIW